jgi:hypothetical protein
MRIKATARRALIVGAVVVAIVGAFPSAALAWDASCVTGDVCVWIDRDFGLPLASQVGPNNNYSGQQYPNSPSYINDSASSVANYYTDKDIVFYHDAYGSGSTLCVDSWYQYSWVGLSNNDKFSSHSVNINDDLC